MFRQEQVIIELAAVLLDEGVGLPDVPSGDLELQILVLSQILAKTCVLEGHSSFNE